MLIAYGFSFGLTQLLMGIQPLASILKRWQAFHQKYDLLLGRTDCSDHDGFARPTICVYLLLRFFKAGYAKSTTGSVGHDAHIFNRPRIGEFT